jgi:hypothetical protein
MNSVHPLPVQLAAAEQRLREAAVAFRAAVLYEAGRMSIDPRHAGRSEAPDCTCSACMASDELNEAAFQYAELLKESN